MFGKITCMARSLLIFTEDSVFEAGLIGTTLRIEALTACKGDHLMWAYLARRCSQRRCWAGIILSVTIPGNVYVLSHSSENASS